VTSDWVPLLREREKHRERERERQGFPTHLCLDIIPCMCLIRSATVAVIIITRSTRTFTPTLLPLHPCFATATTTFATTRRGFSLARFLESSVPSVPRPSSLFALSCGFVVQVVRNRATSAFGMLRLYVGSEGVAES
jgi:uncharacterized membrane protein (GlpM family)